MNKLSRKISHAVFVRAVLIFLGLAVVVSAVAMIHSVVPVRAAYNPEINYQGKLTNGSNVAVADGTYNMEFELYDALGSGNPPTGGNLLWTETRTGANKVQVTNGVFSVMLGEVTAFSSLDFNQTLFLSVNIGGTGTPTWDGDMAPRKKIGAVPAAFLATNLRGTGTVDITNTATQATFNYDGSNRATLAVASTGFTTLTAVGSGAGFNITGGNVGIGTSTLSAKLHVTATTEQLRLGYDASNFASFTTSATGNLTVAPSGSNLAVTGNVDVSGSLTAGTADAFVVSSGGTVTAGIWNGTDIAVADGGTGAGTSQAAINNLSQLTTEGDLLFRNATDSTRLARGTNGQCLTSSTATVLWGSCGAGGSPTLDTVQAAAGPATIANANNAIAWNWGTLTTQTGMAFGGGSAMTTGTAFKVGGATFVHTTAETGQAMNIDVTDASTNASGASVTNALDIDTTINTSGAGTKQINALNVSTPTLTGCATGACTFAGLRVTAGTGTLANLTSYGAYIDAGTGSGTEYAAAFMNGNVGIGTDTPLNLLQVGSAINRGDLVVYGNITAQGLKDFTALTNVTDVFVYDTQKDSDTGKWVESANSEITAWATETKDDGPGDSCVIASDDRCGTSTFPEKAIIVSTPDSVYIFDEKSNTMWMKFTQGGTFALGADSTNNPSSVFALNGVVYVGTNGAAATGLYAFDFKQNRMYRYNSTNRVESDTSIETRNTTTTYASNPAAKAALVASDINDVHATLYYGSAGTLTNGGPLSGATFVAVATNSGMSVINIPGAVTVDYADNAADDYTAVFLTRRGRLYGLNTGIAADQVERWGGVATGAVFTDTVVADQATPTKLWNVAATTPGRLWPTTVTFNTAAPDALEVIERASGADDVTAPGADIIYVGHSLGMTEIHDNNAIAASATVQPYVKYYTTSYMTGNLTGTNKAFWPFNETTGTVLTNQGGASSFSLQLAAKNGAVLGVNGVHGTGIRLDGVNDYLCGDSNSDATCDTDTDMNTAATAFNISGWFKHSTTAPGAGTDVIVDRRSLTDGGAAGVGYAVEMNTTGQIIFGIQDTAATDAFDDSVTSTQAFNDNQWHHFVANNTDTAICLYIDGRLAVACDATLAATLTLDAAGQLFTIGADLTTAGGVNFWDGDIDDIQYSGIGATTTDSINQAAVRKMFLDGRNALARWTAIVTDATSASTTTLTDTGEAWGINEMTGQIVEITGGTGGAAACVGQTRRIISNTATQITFTPALSSCTPDTSTDFEMNPEVLYGESNIVRAIGSYDQPLGETREVYVATDNGTDGGGVTAFDGYGSSTVFDVYHADAKKVDGGGTEWTGTDTDDIQALGIISNVTAIGSLGGTWVETRNLDLKEAVDRFKYDLNNIRLELVNDAITGSSQEFSAGADLAEYYYSNSPLSPGDVVAIQSDQLAGIDKSTSQYQKNLLGVVSTQPGITLGPKGESDNAYPIALSGRIPVKFSAENGLVQPGDYLTSASIPGVAMRATGAGPVLGKVLYVGVREGQQQICQSTNSLDNTASETESVEQPPVDQEICDQVMMFVELGDFSGLPIEQLMGEMNAKITETALTKIPDKDAVLIDSGDFGAGETKQEKILAFLNQMKKSKEEIGVSSQILTDRLSATFEVITPSLVADGLDVLTIGSSGRGIDVLSDFNFIGRPYFNADTGGFAKVLAGDRYADIVFDREYLEQPTVSVSITLEEDLRLTEETDPAIINSLNVLDDGQVELLFGSGIQQIVTRKSVYGFRIMLNKPAPQDILFSWIALAVKTPRLVVSDGLGTPSLPENIGPYPNVLPDDGVVAGISTGSGATDTNIIFGNDEPGNSSQIPPSEIPAPHLNGSEDTGSVNEDQTPLPDLPTDLPQDSPGDGSTGLE